MEVLEGRCRIRPELGEGRRTERDPSGTKQPRRVPTPVARGLVIWNS